MMADRTIDIITAVIIIIICLFVSEHDDSISCARICIKVWNSPDLARINNPF